MSEPQADGSTLRESLESVERQTGKRPARLIGPALPDEAAHIWGWFVALSNQRGSSGFGIEPLRWLDIWAWSSLSGTLAFPWEIDAIVRIDAIYRKVRAEQHRRAEASKPKGKRKG